MIDDAVALIQKKMGKGRICKASELPPERRLPTGSLSLDLFTGGWVLGGFHLFVGAPGAGKSSLAYAAAANAEKLGLKWAIVDVEGSLSEQKMGYIGLEDGVVSRPENLEEAADIANILVRSGEFGVVIFDSIEAPATMDELDISKPLEGKQYPVGAMVTNRLCRLICSGLAPAADGTPNETCVIVINQLRESLSPFKKNRPPRGLGQLYHNTFHVELSRIGKMEVTEKAGGEKVKRVVGIQTQWHIPKSKRSAPFQRGVFGLWTDETSNGLFKPCQIDVEGEILLYGQVFGFIKRRGAMFEYGDITLGRGEFAAKSFLRENKEVRDEIERNIREEAVVAEERKKSGKEDKGQTDPK